MQSSRTCSTITMPSTSECSTSPTAGWTSPYVAEDLGSQHGLLMGLEQIRRAAATELTKGGEQQALLGFSETQDTISVIEEKAEIVDKAFQRFHQMQVDFDMDAQLFAEQKAELRDRLRELTNELDQYLAGEYKVDPSKPKQYEHWCPHP